MAAKAGLVVMSERVTRATADRLKTLESDDNLLFDTLSVTSLFTLLEKEGMDRFKLVRVVAGATVGRSFEDKLVRSPTVDLGVG